MKSSARSRLRAGAAALAAVLAVTSVALAPGCGESATEQGGTSSAVAEPSRLRPKERRLLDVYERQIQAHCVRVARSLVDPRAGPSPRQEAEAFAAADELVALVARKPTAPFGPGQDLRLFLSDVVENLEGSNCDPRMVGRLEQGLAEIPVS